MAEDLMKLFEEAEKAEAPKPKKEDKKEKEDEETITITTKEKDGEETTEKITKEELVQKPETVEEETQQQPEEAGTHDAIEDHEKMALEKVEPPKKDEPEPTPSENDDVSFIREPSKEKKTWADDIRETILIFGLPKKGKTWAYCSVIDYILNRKGNVYIISTDAGFPRTAKAYFGDKLPSVIDRIDVKTVFDINGIRSYYNEIKDKLKPEDLLVIDLVSDCWEWAQVDFVEQMSSGDIEEFVVNAMRDIKKFGLFDDNKWNYIKALHKFVEDIIIRKPCNFIGVANEKAVDVEVIKGGNKVKEMLVDLGFGDLGVRAGGFKLLPYKFETVVRVGYDEKSHFLQVIGDRGFGRDLKQRSYGRNMYGKLLEWRRSRNMWTK